MPTLPPKACATPGCPRVARTGTLHCAEHTKARNEHNEQRHAAAKRFYKSVVWQRLRAAHLYAEPLCRECRKAGRVVAAGEVDHIDGNYRNNMPSNHQSLCRECHARKTVREQGALTNGGVGA